MVNLGVCSFFFHQNDCFYHFIVYLCIMEQQLRKTFCRYDMVCDTPGGAGLELIEMPEFFTNRKGIETDSAHLHGFYEIVWFKEGEGVHTVDFTQYPVKRNTVFFISPGQVHSFDMRHDQKGIVLKFCDELLSDASGGDSVYIKYNAFHAFDSLPCNSISDADAGKLDLIVRAISEELQNSNALGHKEYLQSLVKLFIIHIERGNVTQGKNLNRTAHRVFIAFRQRLEENYKTLHTVKDYAARMNISTKTLTQAVSECSSYTPLEIINGRILLEAKRLLRYSNLMVKEVAFNLGFEDPSYFVKFFKRKVGCSPAEYR